MNVLDFDLELDLNVNFISPMWPENDFSDVDADAILADNFSINSELDWNSNSNEMVEELYSEETNTASGASNVLPYYHIEQVKDNGLESWPDTGSLFELEVFNECFNSSDLLETFQIENTFEITSTPVLPATSTSINIMDTDPLHIIEWNRRRSLLYDKNEFEHDAANECYERRIKSTCTSSSVSTLPTNLDQRTFKCSVRNCDKKYYKASHLKSHMRRHTGVKPFACDWDGCKWRFSRSDELARHKRSHSGIKPYACDLCDKAFSRSDHLSKHAKVHMKKLALYGTPIITKKCNYKYLTLDRISIK